MVAAGLAGLLWWRHRPKGLRELVAQTAPVVLTLAGLLAEDGARAWVVLAGVSIGVVVILATTQADLREWREESRSSWRHRVEERVATVLQAIDTLPYGEASETDLDRVLEQIVELSGMEVQDDIVQALRDRYVELLRKGALLRARGGSLTEIAAIRRQLEHEYVA